MNALQAAAGQDMRTLLKSIGFGDFNCTGIIPYMFIAPAQSDPDMPWVIQVIEHLQKTMNGMGAQLPVTGRLDRPTVLAMRQFTGASWPRQQWGQIVYAVVGGKGRGQRVSSAADAITAAEVDSLSGLSLPALPVVPGGIFTYAAGAAALYLLLRKKR